MNSSENNTTNSSMNNSTNNSNLEYKLFPDSYSQNEVARCNTSRITAENSNNKEYNQGLFPNFLSGLPSIWSEPLDNFNSSNNEREFASSYHSNVFTYKKIQQSQPMQPLQSIQQMQTMYSMQPIQQIQPMQSMQSMQSIQQSQQSQHAQQIHRIGDEENSIQRRTEPRLDDYWKLDTFQIFPDYGFWNHSQSRFSLFSDNRSLYDQVDVVPQCNTQQNLQENQFTPSTSSLLQMKDENQSNPSTISKLGLFLQSLGEKKDSQSSAEEHFIAPPSGLNTPVSTKKPIKIRPSDATPRGTSSSQASSQKQDNNLIRMIYHNLITCQSGDCIKRHSCLQCIDCDSLQCEICSNINIGSLLHNDCEELFGWEKKDLERIPGYCRNCEKQSRFALNLGLMKLLMSFDHYKKYAEIIQVTRRKEFEKLDIFRPKD